jgi:nicotinamidase-related amidase
MPLTSLDPNTALIVIDLQKGIVNGTSFIPSARSLTERAC